MSYINNLKRQAYNKPSELLVPMSRVMTVADHVKATVGPMDSSLTSELIVQWLLDGKVRMLGVPIRVVVYDPRH